MIQEIFAVFLFLTIIIHETLTQTFEIKIKENTPENVYTHDLNSFDNSGSEATKNKQFTLIASSNPKTNSIFILKTDGKLYTSRLIDREQLCSQIDECCHNKYLCTFSILVAVSSVSMISPQTFECRINIEDENDNAPKFPLTKTVIPIKESDPVGSLYSLPLAIDLDSDKYSIKQYKLPEEVRFPAVFCLEQSRPSSNLNLHLIQKLDREKKSSYELTLLAIDGGSPSLTGTLLIEIKILDVNDNPPKLTRNSYIVNQKESDFSAQSLVTIEATDDDENENAELFFKIVNENPSETDANKFFRVEHGTGKLFLNQPLDYEKQEKHRFFVEVSNKNGNTETATATVLINVENLNDEKPEISINYLNMGKNNADVEENDSRTRFVALATVTDRDKGIGGQVTCKLVNFDDVFEIQVKELSKFPNQYNIQTKVSLDREKVAFFKAVMECDDKGYPSLRTKKEINIKVKDANDNTPEIRIDPNISVRENSPRRTIITKIQAVDDDEGENGMLTFSISNSEEQTLRLLEVDPVSGELRTKEVIDRERDIEPLKILIVELTVSDKGRPPKSRTKRFPVKIEDENDNAPQFPSEIIHFSVTENQNPEFTLGEIPVTDKDDESQLKISIAPSSDQHSNPFSIFRKDNRFYLNTTRRFDWEKEKSFSMKVIASDGHGYKSHTVTAEIVVTIRDENDNDPTIIFPTQKNFTIPRLSFLEKSGFTVLTISAVDKDSSETNNGKLCYQIFDNKDLFMIDATTGAIRTTRPMNRLDMGRFEVKVMVRDYGTPSRETSINLYIEVDDSKPQLYNESYKDNEENTAVPSSNYLWTKEGFLVVSLIVLLLFLLICVCMILYMRHVKGLFHSLPNIFIACRRQAKHRKDSKSGSCHKSLSHIPFESNPRNSPMSFPTTTRSYHDKAVPNYNLNQYDSSVNSTNFTLDPHLPAAVAATAANQYRQYDTMKYQHYSPTMIVPNAMSSTYNYDKLFYLPSTSHGDALIHMSSPSLTNNNNNSFYDNRTQTIPHSIGHNLPICRRIINNIESSPVTSIRHVKACPDPCHDLDDTKVSVTDPGEGNPSIPRPTASPNDKIDTYAVTYPVEQSTFV